MNDGAFTTRYHWYLGSRFILFRFSGIDIVLLFHYIASYHSISKELGAYLFVAYLTSQTSQLLPTPHERNATFGGMSAGFSTGYILRY